MITETAVETSEAFSQAYTATAFGPPGCSYGVSCDGQYGVVVVMCPTSIGPLSIEKAVAGSSYQEAVLGYSGTFPSNGADNEYDAYVDPNTTYNFAVLDDPNGIASLYEFTVATPGSSSSSGGGGRGGCGGHTCQM